MKRERRKLTNLTGKAKMKKLLTICAIAGLMFGLCSGRLALLVGPTAHAESKFSSSGYGGIIDDPEVLFSKPRAVRNDVARNTDEIIVLRHFKIKKGTFSEFFQLSRDGVWPYAGKIGARVVGMWKAIHPPNVEGSADRASPKLDEVYLMTRYASVQHWKATRSFTRLGGNGPDAEKAFKALIARHKLTLESSFVFLKGYLSSNPPYFMPPLPERYQLVPAADPES
jgi:hypothetical protein